MSAGGPAELSSGAMRRAARAALSTALAAVVATGLSACGGSESVSRTIDATKGGGGEGAGFSPDTITVDKRNRVHLEVGNTTASLHGFSIEGYGVVEQVSPGNVLDVEFTAINAGTYRVYCQLHETHRTATLVVR